MPGTYGYGGDQAGESSADDPDYSPTTMASDIDMEGEEMLDMESEEAERLARAAELADSESESEEDRPALGAGGQTLPLAMNGSFLDFTLI